MGEYVCVVSTSANEVLVASHVPVFSLAAESSTVEIGVRGVSEMIGLTRMLRSFEMRREKEYHIGNVRISISELVARQRKAQGQ